MRESSLVSNFKMNAKRAVSGAVMAIWPNTTKTRTLLNLFGLWLCSRYEQRFDGFNGTATLFIAIKM
jgi:hypothetical protein